MVIITPPRRLMGMYRISGEFVNNFTVACKLFRINLTAEDQERDLEHLNSFLSKHHILSINEEYVSGKVDRWQVFVTYYDVSANIKCDEEESITRKKVEAQSRTVEPHTRVEEESPAETENQTQLKEILAQWRKKKGLEEGIPLYRVLTNSAIDQIVANMPDQVAKLHMIKGIGMKTQEKYGAEIIGMIRKHREDIV